MKKINIILLAITLMISSSGYAAIELPAIIGSNMVLQRNSEVAIWGWADAREKLQLECSWSDQEYSVKADRDGKWMIRIGTSNSKEPQEIKITGKNSDVVLENVLFGEVWLCSGQSNMQQPLKGYYGQPTFGSAKAIMEATDSNIRLFSVQRDASLEPLPKLSKEASWEEASPESVANFSAVAYFFGKILKDALDVPVGLIHSSWGGSNIEAWMSEENIENFMEVELDESDLDQRPNKKPTLLYNAMLKPLMPFTIKGMLWYQGEANRKAPVQYMKLQPAMVKELRRQFESGDFSFYFAQIAPYSYGSDAQVFSTVENSAFIREAQARCVDLIPNSGIAITLDIGDQFCIHPPKKQPVAERMARLALNRDYGMTALDGISPVYDAMEISEGTATLSFKHAETGLFAYDKLSGFEIAGEDRVFYPAEAQIVDRKLVKVRSSRVPNPAAVRYCWSNWAVGTLYDANLLPASSFRTDDWEESTRFSVEEK